MELLFALITLVIGLVVGYFVGDKLRLQRYQQEMGDLEAMRTRLLEEAEKQARDIVLNGKDEALKLQQEVEADAKQQSRQVRNE